MNLRGILFCLFMLSACLSGLYGEGASRVLALKGYLDRDEVTAAEKSLKTFDVEQPLLIELNSSSGDLDAVFDLVKVLYTWKLANKQQIILYIQDSAIGPAALFPFLADELVTSVFVSWGDILVSTETGEPTNILRSRVRSLVTPSHPKAALQRLIAEGMVDSEIEIIENDGWRQRPAGDTGIYSVISPKGERLVLGQVQLRELGLVARVESIETFRARYALSTEEQARLDEDEGLGGSLAVTKDSLEAALKEHIKFSRTESNRIGHIKIDDRKHGITQATWIYVKSALDYYKENKPAFIILELNTPGGEVFSSQKISDALKEMDTGHGVPVLAYINNWAISAGAMLAYSCRFVAIAKDASMGAAEPVFAGQGGKMETAPEKINSALRTDFANRAGFFDRNTDIAEAMVDKDIILVLRHGKVLRLDTEGQIRSTGPEKDSILTAKGKLLTLSADQMMRLGVADLRVSPKPVGLISEEERGKGKWPANKELLFQQEFFKDIPEAFVDSFKPDWKVSFLALLATPAVASFLFLGMMLGFYVEINSPGFGFPGSLGLVCLSLIVISSFALDIVNWLEVVFVLAGVCLLGMELFVIPGFGIAGIAGIVLFVVGLFALMLPGIESISYDVGSHTMNAAGEVFLERLAWLCGALVLGTIAMFVFGRYLIPSLGTFSRLVLETQEGTTEDLSSAQERSSLPSLGVNGFADTPLRPAGRVRVGDRVYNAMSDGVYIQKDSPVIIVRIEGNRVFVDPTE